jgi:D-threo-aldose 1-dehydrogenase
MRTKILGRTGLEVSIVGLGTAFIGIPTPNQAPKEYSGGPSQMDEDLGVATVHAAVEAGCTLIDTAPLYGHGRSERIIARAFQERPDLKARCAVTTKVGHMPKGFDYSYDMTMRCVEESQERLGMERFEVLYIHDAMGQPMGRVMGKSGTMGALRKLQDRGIVKHIGSATNDPAVNALYIETGEFDAAVVPDAYSLLNQTALERIMPAAERHNVGIVIATPLERGLLATGPVEGIDYLNRKFSQASLDHVAKIGALCSRHAIPLAAAALQWCVRHPQMASTIPGARTPEEARANGAAGDMIIPEDFWAELEPLVKHWEQGVDR